MASWRHELEADARQHGRPTHCAHTSRYCFALIGGRGCRNATPWTDAHFICSGTYDARRVLRERTARAACCSSRIALWECAGRVHVAVCLLGHALLHVLISQSDSLGARGGMAAGRLRVGLGWGRKLVRTRITLPVCTRLAYVDA